MEEKILRVGVDTKDADPPTQKLGRTFRATGDSAKKMESEIDKSNKALDQTGRKAKTAGDSVDRFDRSVKGTQTSLQRMHTGLGGVTRLLGTIGVGVGFAHMIQEAREFEEALLQIRGLVGATAEQVQIYRERIMELTSVTGRGPQELAKALYFVTSAGFSGAEALDVLEQSAKAAASGLGETKDVAYAVTAAVNAFGEETLGAEEAVGVLVATVREGSAEANTIATSIGRVISLAANLGVSFQEVGAGIAAITRVGPSADEAVTELLGIFNALLDPGERAEQVLVKFGTSSEQLRTILKERGLLELLLQLKDIIGENEEAFAQVFPNVRALVGVLNLVGKNVDDVRTIFEKLNRETGQSARQSFKDTEGAGRDLNRGMAELNKSMGELGEIILPGLAMEVQGVAWALGKLEHGIRGVILALAEMKVGAQEPLSRIRDQINDALLLLDQGGTFGNPARAAEGFMRRLMLSEEDKREVEGRLKYLQRYFAQTLVDSAPAVFESVQKEFDKWMGGVKENKNFRFFQDAGVQKPTGQQKLGGVETFADKDKEALQNLMDTYDAFNKQLLDTTTRLDLLQKAVRTKNATLQQSVDTYDGIIEALAEMAFKTDDFAKGMVNADKVITVIDESLIKGTASATGAANAYEKLAESMTTAAVRSNSFKEASENAGSATAKLGELVRGGKLGADEAASSFQTMADKLIGLINNSRDMAEAVQRLGDVQRLLNQGFAEGFTSADAMKSTLTDLTQQLARAAVSTEDYGLAFSNARQIVELMKREVESGAMSAQAARNIYEQMVDTLKKLNPEMRKAADIQSKWKELTEASKTPLDEYNERVKALNKLAQDLIALGMDAHVVMQELAQGLAQAGKDYQQAMEDADPKVQKLKDSIDRVGDASANAFSQMIQQAQSFNDVLNGLLRTIADLIIQLLVLEPLKNSIVTGLQGAFGISGNAPIGGGGGLPPGVTPAASGAEMLPGRTYLVGERGPELIVAPDKGGRIFTDQETRKIMSGKTKPVLVGGESPANKTVVNVVNNTGQTATVNRRTDSSGNEVIDVIVGTVARNINERGVINKTMNQAGRMMRR